MQVFVFFYFVWKKSRKMYIGKTILWGDCHQSLSGSLNRDCQQNTND